MNVLTFDIEDWYHILDNDSTRSENDWINHPTRIHESVNRILDLLSQSNKKATFFCLGWIAKTCPEVIKLIDRHGHEIASHSFSHTLVYDQSPGEFQQDLKKSVEYLEDLTGKKVRAYRAPGFSVTAETPWFFDILCQNGIELDCSLSSARHSHGGYDGFSGKQPLLITSKGMQIKELPLSSQGFAGKQFLFSGGGYFRLYPYWLISSLMRRSDYTMTYFHPRDFDPDQPVLEDLSLSRKFKSYYGLSYSYNKLVKLLNDFDFTSVYEYDRMIDWDTVPVFEL